MLESDKSPDISPTRNSSADGSNNNHDATKAEEEEETKEGLITRFVVAPVIFVSFILSLAWVDRWSRAREGEGRSVGRNGDRHRIVHRRLIRWEVVRAWEVRERLVLVGLTVGLLLGGVLVHSMWRVWDGSIGI
ncbi:MAG: hypothetical protein M1816_007345 [Peltula sp. TS41687]|nr:MAG: hypothetical protein M1816_007345 [Peltula sp. TS41687]